MANFLNIYQATVVRRKVAVFTRAKNSKSLKRLLSFKAARRDTSQKPNSTIFIYMRAVRMELNNLNKTPLGVFDKTKNGNKIK